MRLKKGVTLLAERIGDGPPVERQRTYLMSVRTRLSGGDVVGGDEADQPRPIRIDRTLIAGLFYALDGMAVGGCRKVRVAPHLAYGDAGVPGLIPPTAVLTLEITVHAAA